MDNLTHTLVGVLLARAGLQRVSPQATVLCVVAANIPDIDIFTAASAIDYLNYHRHLTHSLPAVPVMACLAVGFVVLGQWVFGRKEKLPWGRAWLVALAAALTHPVLDLANTYGVRLWLPFSARWYSWDVLFIVDLWVWAMLGVAVLAPMLMKLVQAEIGAGETRGRFAARAGLFAVIVFIGAKGVLHQRAIALMDAFEYGGKPALRVAAFAPPLGWNPFAWAGFVETAEYYQTPDVDLLLGNYDPTSGQRFYKEPPGPALEAALRISVGADYARFARYRFDQVQKVQGGYVVEISDFRFRRPGRVAFRCTIELDEAFRVRRQEFEF
jgi:inner membrane protein